MELDLYFLREKVMDKSLAVHHILGVDQIADILTKPLLGPFFERLRNKLQVSPLGALELRGSVKN